MLALALGQESATPPADPRSPHVCIVATGGYGRREVCPFSDIDVTICYLPGVRGIKEISSAVLYPLWDSGLKVGHSVRTPKEAVGVASAETDVATSHLDTRYVAGSEAAFEELSARLSSFFKKKADRLVEAILDKRNRRLGSLGEFDGLGRRAGSLHTDLKLGSGGLRDISFLEWVATLSGVRLDEVLSEAEYASLNRAKSHLLLLRSALHLCYGRQHDRIDHGAVFRLEQRFGPGLTDRLLRSALSSMLKAEYLVAKGLGELVATRRIVRGRGEREAARTSDPDSPSPSPAGTTAHFDAQVASELLMERIRGPEEGLLEDLVGMQARGRLQAAIPEWRAIEGLYQRDPYHLFTVDIHSIAATARVGHAFDKALLDSPELWPPHLVSSLRELAHGAPEAADRHAELRLACLLHDIGKGASPDRPGTDNTAGAPEGLRPPGAGEEPPARAAHSGKAERRHDAHSRHAVEGAEVAGTIARRLGLPAESTKRCESLVRHHLLLAQIASERDAGDEATLDLVTSVITEASLLDQLYLLTLADSSATGPRAWNAWRRSLLTRLYLACRNKLETARDSQGEGARPFEGELRRRLFEYLRSAGMETRTAKQIRDSAPRQLLWLEEADTTLVAAALVRLVGGDRHPVLEGRALGDGYHSLVVAAYDAPGLFAKIAGAMAVCGLSVISAQASTLELDPPIACDLFVVGGEATRAPGTVEFASIEAKLRSVVGGRLALSYRLALKTREWKESLQARSRRSGGSSPLPETPEVRILDDASGECTVVEIRAPNRPRLLYDVASTLAELCLDIKSAKISTLADTAADVFYITDLEGNKIVDFDYLREVRAALTYALSRGL